jgi:hypothetical protein
VRKLVSPEMTSLHYALCLSGDLQAAGTSSYLLPSDRVVRRKPPSTSSKNVQSLELAEVRHGCFETFVWKCIHLIT